MINLKVFFLTIKQFLTQGLLTGFLPEPEQSSPADFYDP